MFGDLGSGSVFHTLSWASHRSHRPVKSAGSAETIAAAQALDEGKLLKLAMQAVLQIPIELILVVDSKDLFDSLTSCRNATDRAIRGDVSVIRYDFETKAVNKVIWIPGSCNLSDPMTKLNSALAQSLQLLLVGGEIPMDIDKSEERESDLSTG